MAYATALTTLLDNGDYSLHAQISPILSTQGDHAFIITSKRRTARDPNEEHVKFIACLDRAGVQALSTLLEATLKLHSAGVSQ